MKEKLTISTIIDSDIEKVWAYYTLPEHIRRWNHASSDWHTPFAKNDLKAGGKFLFRMESKDESTGFDFSGIYKRVDKEKLIEYEIDDKRNVEVLFKKEGSKTQITINFEAEDQNSIEMQRDGWQAILDNFKKYTETH